MLNLVEPTLIRLRLNFQHADGTLNLMFERKKVLARIRAARRHQVHPGEPW